MSDTAPGVVPIKSLWIAFGRRAATAAGAITALTSLLSHTPVWVASMRGALAWLAVLALTRVGSWLLERTRSEQAGAVAEGENEDTMEAAQ